MLLLQPVGQDTLRAATFATLGAGSWARKYKLSVPFDWKSGANFRDRFVSLPLVERLLKDMPRGLESMLPEHTVRVRQWQANRLATESDPDFSPGGQYYKGTERHAALATLLDSNGPSHPYFAPEQLTASRLFSTYASYWYSWDNTVHQGWQSDLACTIGPYAEILQYIATAIFDKVAPGQFVEARRFMEAVVAAEQQKNKLDCDKKWSSRVPIIEKLIQESRYADLGDAIADLIRAGVVVDVTQSGIEPRTALAFTSTATSISPTAVQAARRPAPKYPPGTIHYYSGGLYRIAIPAGSAVVLRGLGAVPAKTYKEIAPSVTDPAAQGSTLTQKEKFLLLTGQYRWYKDWKYIVPISVATVGVATGTAVFIRRRRRRQLRV